MRRFAPRRAVENLLINPQCLIAQEGTSFAAMASGDYVLDGFKYIKSGAMVHTGSQASDNPAASNRLYNGTKAVKLDCTTADASIAAGDYCSLMCFVEGYDAPRCYELPFVLTFWHKHTKTGTYCVAVRNSGNDRSVVKEYTQSTADTWEKTTLIFAASPTAGTWDFTNGIGLQISFALACGSTYQTTADAWQTGNYLATSSQVNGCDSTSNNFLLTDVALYPGSRDLGFYAPDFSEQVSRCQRYFEKSYPLDTAPGSLTGDGAMQGVAASSVFLYEIEHRYGIVKRDSASVTLYGYQNGTDGQVSRYNIGTSFLANVNASIGNNGQAAFAISGGGNFTAGDLIRYHYTADARF